MGTCKEILSSSVSEVVILFQKRKFWTLVEDHLNIFSKWEPVNQVQPPPTLRVPQLPQQRPLILRLNVRCISNNRRWLRFWSRRQSVPCITKAKAAAARSSQ